MSRARTQEELEPLIAQSRRETPLPKMQLAILCLGTVSRIAQAYSLSLTEPSYDSQTCGTHCLYPGMLPLLHGLVCEVESDTILFCQIFPYVNRVGVHDSNVDVISDTAPAA